MAQLMTKIIIPTCNRSAKLARTLECYHSFEPKCSPAIVVLDGSDGEYREQNERISRMYSTVEYVARPGSGFIPRLIEHLEQYQGSTLVCLGTDEDVFLPEYLTLATEFLNSHPDYSMLLGRYITFLRPLGPLNRLSHQRDVITALDINQEDMNRRISLLACAIGVGCCPVYWGVRRADHLLESLKYQNKLYFQSSQELIDQILLAYQGKIKISPLPMLLRDETNLDYVYTEDRHDHFNYFPPEECQLLMNLLTDLGSEDLARAATAFTDRYSLDYVTAGSPSLAVQSHKKTYAKYDPIRPEDKNFFYRSVFNLMRGATILAEMLTAARDIKVLKRMYSRSTLDIFVRKVKSNQLS
jgi:glycosyltransferase domain-containing protein